LESLTDLTALYLGGGVLVANLAATAKKPAEYLGPAALGYALSWLARESGEHDPAWLADLEAAPRAAFRRGMAYLEAERSDGHAQ
jgi:hypothetical protein